MVILGEGDEAVIEVIEYVTEEVTEIGDTIATEEVEEDILTIVGIDIIIDTVDLLVFSSNSNLE